MRKLQISTLILLSLVLGSTLAASVIIPGYGKTNANLEIHEDKTVTIGMSFEIDTTVLVDNDTLPVDLFSLIEEALENDSIQFTEVVLEALNDSLAPRNLTISDFTISVDSDAKQVFFNYTITGATVEHTIIRSNRTWQFNPTILWFDFVERSTTATLNNTYRYNFNWIDEDPEGTYTRNYTRSNTNFTYVFDLSDIFYYRALSKYPIAQWNQTGNLFSANISYVLNADFGVILVNLQLPESARGAYAESNSIIFHISQGIDVPFIFSFLGVGAVFVFLGFGLSNVTRGKEEKQPQPFQEKWQARHRKRKKRKK